MYDENSILRGQNVTVISLQQSNLESCLSVFKKASSFAELYEKFDDLWDSAKRDIKNDYIQANVKRFLIIENSKEVLICLKTKTSNGKNHGVTNI